MRNRALWTFLVTSFVLFMVQLDNLVVAIALPTIKHELNASLEALEWTVNAYTLVFAVLLLTGAAIGDRFGRKRVFLGGLVLFTAASAAAAMSTSAGELVAARAAQGLGAAVLTPLTLTLLSAAVSPERRALALGAWGAVGGLGIAIGPVVGGAVVAGASWQWIFWVNVPIGILLLPAGAIWLRESRGATRPLDLVGTALASAGLFAIVLGLVESGAWGWTSARIIGLFAVGAVLFGLFLVWESRTPHPMLPLRLFRSRAFALINVTALMLHFGLFGSIFLLAQFFQVAQGKSALEAGLLTLPWTAVPAVVAPVAAGLAKRFGGHRIIAAGMFFQALGLAWLALVSTPTVPYTELLLPFFTCGLGLGLFFAPIANLVLSTVDRTEEGIASGTNNAIRQIGGVFGVAVLASIFAHNGSYTSPQSFADGSIPAVWVGAAVVAAGVVTALLIRPLRKRPVPPARSDRTLETRNDDDHHAHPR
ncbi:MFS transporter [Actinomadura fulvescens]|uniref:MFS transporter n=1 Tax=Actinomadura fulvescens TaxID=46160 RepID=A0ABP6C8R0_9ACTN